MIAAVSEMADTRMTHSPQQMDGLGRLIGSLL
ncbi:protein of unknown function [Methylorubrum extorquens]|uniref:Uncharacterized protein n=1 Tax=Methylorubrum extorquens TaxID=408 RepID=A0A2N9AYK0_METEX|nr:protein of unknown function [Methylorubrum extorquens]